MLEILIIFTALVIVVTGLVGLKRTRDPLSPLTVFAPMLVYIYVYHAWAVTHNESLQTIFPDLQRLELVHLVTLPSIAAFCIGCIWERRPRSHASRRFVLLEGGMQRSTRLALARLAVLMGVIAVATFWLMLINSGGWSKVFSVSKPVFRSLGSGYLSELRMLSYPAVLLLAVAWQGKRLGPGKILTFLLIASPELIMATFGGRRGRLFLSVCALLACWCIVRGTRPKLSHVMIVLAVLGGMLLALGRHRSDLFSPWQGEVAAAQHSDEIDPDALTVGDEYVSAAATILACHDLGRHHWGVRYFVTLFVRPIPKQIWPSKYSDFDMSWMVYNPGRCGFSASDWMSTVGFIPAEGNAGGFVADSFLEFSWGCIPLCFLIGLFYSKMWKYWTLHGGLSAILYMELLILSVFLPSQSVGAWAYRALLLMVPTWVIWRTVVEPRGRRTLQRGRHRQQPGAPSYPVASMVKAGHR